MSIKNTLTSIQETYAGTWYKALIAIFSVIFGGIVISHFIFGAEISLYGFLGNCLVGFGLMLLAIFLKRKYPKKPN
jgi:hypothetical protein